MAAALRFPVLVALASLSLAVVHLFAGRLRFSEVPRSYWLSTAGGVSVAYVFVHVLPELGERQHAFEGPVLSSLEHQGYLLALAGFALFYGLEQLARRSQRRDGGEVGSDDEVRRGGDEAERDGEVAGVETETSTGVFWIHVGSFVAYNGLVGYLLVHRETEGLASLGLFAVALALHFVVNDHGLREHHHEAYDDVGRWLLAGGILAGTVVGWAITVTEAVISASFAVLAGGIVLNVVKEELPEERESNFWAFGGGAAVYAAVLLLV